VTGQEKDGMTGSKAGSDGLQHIGNRGSTFRRWEQITDHEYFNLTDPITAN